jgi:hypothetical protein
MQMAVIVCPAYNKTLPSGATWVGEWIVRMHRKPIKLLEEHYKKIIPLEQKCFL